MITNRNITEKGVKMLKDGLVGVLLGILISSFFISCGVPVIEEIPSHATTGRLFDLMKYTELGFLICLLYTSDAADE